MGKDNRKEKGIKAPEKIPPFQKKRGDQPGAGYLDELERRPKEPVQLADREKEEETEY